jgi:hypothetical protein
MVKVGVMVGVGVMVRVSVMVGVCVMVGVGVSVGVGVEVAVKVGLGVGVFNSERGNVELQPTNTQARREISQGATRRGRTTVDLE